MQYWGALRAIRDQLVDPFRITPFTQSETFFRIDPKIWAASKKRVQDRGSEAAQKLAAHRAKPVPPGQQPAAVLQGPAQRRLEQHLDEERRLQSVYEEEVLLDYLNSDPNFLSRLSPPPSKPVSPQVLEELEDFFRGNSKK
jgi:hypothetical protein